MQDAPMKIEARFDAALLDGLRRDNARLREALRLMLQADDAICDGVGTKSDQAMLRIAAIDQARALLSKLDLAPTETHGKKG